MKTPKQMLLTIKLGITLEACALTQSEEEFIQYYLEKSDEGHDVNKLSPKVIDCIKKIYGKYF